MSVIRISQDDWFTVHNHLFSSEGEHFAFLKAGFSETTAGPVFQVQEVMLIPDSDVVVEPDGWTVATSAYLRAVNSVSGTRHALIEVHNHSGSGPRFSNIDLEGIREFSDFFFASHPHRPYAATVWCADSVYGEYFTPDGKNEMVRSIMVIGDELRQVVSRPDDNDPVSTTFDRQVPLFTLSGQRALSRFRVGIVGLGGTGSHTAQSLSYLGLKDYVLIDHDVVDETSGNRVVTATCSDLGQPKALLARRLIQGIVPDAKVVWDLCPLPSERGLDLLKSVDVIFGCIDNDGARLVLNELALAFQIPYFDMAVGIQAVSGDVKQVGGRVAAVLPNGPCLHCMGEIDIDEARYYLALEADKRLAERNSYVTGLDVPAPAVVTINAQVAATAVNEFLVMFTGVRPPQPLLEIDVIGSARSSASQWLTPIGIKRPVYCSQCASRGLGDSADISRYWRRTIPPQSP